MVELDKKSMLENGPQVPVEYLFIAITLRSTMRLCCGFKLIFTSGE